MSPVEAANLIVAIVCGPLLIVLFVFLYIEMLDEVKRAWRERRKRRK